MRLEQKLPSRPKLLSEVLVFGISDGCTDILTLLVHKQTNNQMTDDAVCREANIIINLILYT